MLAIERRKKIYEYLHENGNATVFELKALFDVGEETIRRDLTKMEEEGILQRTYGGAFIDEGKHLVLPDKVRETVHVGEKTIIGSICANMINTGDTIFLDGSTTCQFIAKAILYKKNLIVITNAIKIALNLSEAANIKVIFIGGTMRHNTLTFVGHTSKKLLREYYADKAFICCDGIHMINGITDANEQEAEIRSSMFAQAEERILVADSTKFDRTSFKRIGKISEADYLVTDKKLSESWIKKLNDYKVKVICTETEMHL
jgi:DeoR/GlpR family transcriptional regulator of sugar metabolism